MERRGGLVIQFLKLGLEATGQEKGVNAFVGGKVFGAGLGLHRLRKDGVAVVVVDDEEIGVAGAGRCEETSCRIGENLSGHGLAISVDGVSAKCWRFGCRRAELRGGLGLIGRGSRFGIGRRR